MIAGTDPRKPWLSTPEVRRQLGRSVIDFFQPIFAYSPLALGTDLDGETNCFRLLALNPDQRIKAFYIAGTDHCRRATSEGEPDTLQKIERELSVMRGESRRNHAVSFLFLERGEAIAGKDSPDSFLDMHVLPSIPPPALRRPSGRVCESGVDVHLKWLPVIEMNIADERGAHGGYSLARPPEAITVKDVVEASEGAIAPVPCAMTS